MEINVYLSKYDADEIIKNDKKILDWAKFY